MKKTIFMLSLFVCAPLAWSQAVPPDYPAQQNRSLEAQIESVRLNYEDVKAKAEKKLAKEKAAAEKAKAQEAARKAAAAKRLAAQRKAAQLKAQARADKLEKRADESAELDLQLKRLQVRQAAARTQVQEALSAEKVKRAGEIVDSELKKAAGQK